MEAWWVRQAGVREPSTLRIEGLLLERDLLLDGKREIVVQNGSYERTVGRIGQRDPLGTPVIAMCVGEGPALGHAAR